MATVEGTARDGARAKAEANRARKAAVAERRREAILDRRSRGWKVERIAHDLKIEVEDVTRVIKLAREAGDGRALTYKRAAAVAAAPATPTAVAAGVERMAGAIHALATFVEAEGPREIAPRATGLCADVGRQSRAEYVARLRELSAHYAPIAPDAAAGLAHLSDLHEHCDRYFPSFLIPSQGVTLEETDRRFPRHVLAPMTSPSQLCVEG